MGKFQSLTMRSSLLLATVVLMCCISMAHGLRRGLVTSVQSRSSVDYSETTKGTVGTRAGQIAFRVRGELLQSLPQRQNTRSQEILKDTQEQSRASMSPEAMLVEVSEERPHILAGAPVIPETDLEEHELVQATATTTYYQGNAGTTCPPGQLITSQAECLNTAVNSLDVQAGSAWVGSALSIPVGCSIRRAGAANHNDFAPHWNRSPSGVGRADLNPICAGGVFECPDGISSKGVFFPYARPGWSCPWSCPQPSCHKWDSPSILTNHLTCDESRMASEG